MALTRIKTAPTRKHLHLEAWWRYWDVNDRWCRRFDRKPAPVKPVKNKLPANYWQLRAAKLRTTGIPSLGASPLLPDTAFIKSQRHGRRVIFGFTGLVLALILSGMPAGFWPGFLLLIGALFLAVLFVIGFASLIAYAFGDCNLGFGFFIGGN